MNFLDIAKTRYSVRKYTDKKVEAEKLDQILNAAHVAPTAANLQPDALAGRTRRRGVKKDFQGRQSTWGAFSDPCLRRPFEAWKRPFDGKKTTDIDASILTDHMMLEATELGLGSVWICFFKPDIIKEEFQLPDSLEPINILAVGYANETPADPERHLAARIPLSQLVSYEKFD